MNEKNFKKIISLIIVLSLVFSQNFIFDSVKAAGVRYEAEAGSLSGGARIESDHFGYSGSGFVGGFTDGNRGNAAVTFNVNVQTAGIYTLDLAYANSTGSMRTLTLVTDGDVRNKKALGDMGSWDSWGHGYTDISLTAGSHSIKFLYGNADSGNVNLDYLDVQLKYSEADVETIDSSQAVFMGGAFSANDHTGYYGSSFAAGFIDSNKGSAAAEYTFNVSKHGNYILQTRYSNGNSESKTLSAYIDNEYCGQISMSPTIDWDAWSIAEISSKELNRGQHSLKLMFADSDSGNVNIDKVEIILEEEIVESTEAQVPQTEAPTQAQPQTQETTQAFSEEPTQPQETTIHIEAENFAGVTGGVYVPSKQYENSGYITGFARGDSASYNVTVSGSGSYTIGIRASIKYTGTKKINVYIDGLPAATIDIQSTGSFAAFQTFTSPKVYIAKGNHELKLEAATAAGYAINWIELSGELDETETRPSITVPATPPDTQPDTTPQTNPETQSVTQAQTQPGTTPQTNPATQPVTQAPTQPQTEAPTQAPYGYPDMIVTDISWTPSNVSAGDMVEFSAVIKNQGTGVADTGIINGVLFSVDGSSVAWSDNNTDTIYPGQTVTVTATGGPNGTKYWTAYSGAHTITATVNDIGRYNESDMNNNSFSVNMSISEKATEAESVTTESQSGIIADGVYYIINQWQGTYLYEAYSKAAYGSLNAGDAYKWAIVKDGSSYLIWNVATGNSMSAEYISSANGLVSTGRDDDTAAHWNIVPAVTSGYYVLYNMLHPNWMINIEGQLGYAQCYDNVQSSWGSPQWRFEHVGAVPQRPEPPLEEEVTNPDSSGYGATLPYRTYEAEDADTNATVLSRSTAYHTVQAEASGRKAVRLANTGDYVEFTLTEAANTMVIRYCMPDNSSGTGIDATLSLYVNGSHSQDLNLTSSYAWVYGSYPYTNNVNEGLEHRFFDESRFWFNAGTLQAGTKIKLQKDASDTAGYYVIDFIETELVGAQISKPDGYLSVTDYGAVPNDGNDDYNAFVSCIAAARSQHKGVWLPAGTFNLVNKQVIEVQDVNIQGAGMWYTTLYGAGAAFKVSGTCEFHDFSMTGVSKVRNDNGDLAGIEGYEVTNNVIIENVWFEHMKVGIWFYNSTNLRVRGCRIRNTYADGINLCSNVHNAIIENNHFRNTGDDCIAIWPWTEDESNNTIRYNTVQLPMLANGIAVYGGSGHVVNNNAIYDTVAFGGGINISTNFDTPNGFSGQVTVRNNLLVRTSSYDWDNNYERGAFWIYASKREITTPVNIYDNVIYDSTYTGITIEGPQNISNLTFANNSFLSSGTYSTGSNGLFVRSTARGSVLLDGNDFGSTYLERIRNDASGFTVNER